LIGGSAAIALALVLVTAMRSFGAEPDAASVLNDAPASTVTPAVPTIEPPMTTVPLPTIATPADGVRFEADGATYSVGGAGDVIVLGDWDCDGSPGVALLQPDDGDVYLFDRLASQGTPITGRLVATVPGAVDLEAIEQPTGCSSLSVRHADGSPQLIVVGAS
jgi:hypothetical protein